jgi:hypothetical protein
MIAGAALAGGAGTRVGAGTARVEAGAAVGRGAAAGSGVRSRVAPDDAGAVDAPRVGRATGVATALR